jgi:hypothetical protein
MTDESSTATNVASPAAWFWILAIAALLFEAVGAYLFAASLTLDPATLPLDQRSIFEATPKWMTFAWGVAIATGLTGAIALVARRRLAQSLLLISWLAVAVQFAGLFLVKQLRELTPEDHLMVPIVILLLSYGVWQLSLLARKRGWLK